MSRQRVSSGAPWEATVGYSRAIRVGDRVFVAGTTGIGADGQVIADDAYAQAQQAFTIIGEALAEVGASMSDVVRTRIYVVDITRDGDAVGRAHGEIFQTIRPAATMIEVKAFIDPVMRVEIELDAIVE
ncbi:MAG: RidA family protein [Rhodothermaceae bacterium]|nr:RidA family protein [Rhodothermaceae bacterium]